MEGGTGEKEARAEQVERKRISLSCGSTRGPLEGGLLAEKMTSRKGRNREKSLPNPEIPCFG